MRSLLAPVLATACSNAVEIPRADAKGDAADVNGDHAGQPTEGCVTRLLPASPPLLANAILECAGTPEAPVSVAAASEGRAYVSALAYHYILSPSTSLRTLTSSGNLFTFDPDAAVSEPLIPAAWTWLRTDGVGTLYRFGSGAGSSDPRGIYTRDGSGWKFEAPTPVRNVTGLVDAAVTPDGVPFMLYASSVCCDPPSLELLSRPASDWVNESIGPTANPLQFDSARATLNVTPDGGVRVTYLRVGDAAGLYTWRPGQLPRRVLSSIQGQATLRGVRPSAPGAAVSAHSPDAIHALFIDDASDLVDVVLPETTPVEHPCGGSVELINGKCPPGCTEAAEGAARDVHALARTEDGRYWVAYVAGHFEQEYKYEYECEPCACAPKLVRDGTHAKLVIARVTPGASTPIEIAWQADALPGGIDLDARGVHLYLTATVATDSGPPVVRYLRLDTTAFGLP